MGTIVELLRSTWRDAVEILILSVGVYCVLLFARRTRGAAVVIGFVGLLLMLMLVTQLLELRVLEALLGAIALYLAVAVVVLFQPEIRRMLAQLGSMPLASTAHQERQNIEVLVQTVERLADVQIGMLVAIEQSMNVQQAVESGIEVNCVATPEMLETIFFPNNALHDGGVIIRGDRIAYAACIFPLTQQQDLGASLGTRHRAAIGLSEETDAVVVVVSEESGAISFAYQGRLVRNVTAEELRAFLSSILVKTPRGETWVQRVRRWLKPLNPAVVDGKAAVKPEAKL